MQHIARLLDIAGQTGPPSPAYVGVGNLATRYANRNSRDNRPLFHTGRVPGFAAPRRESHPGIIHRTDDVRGKRDGQSPSRIALENAMRDQQNGSTSKCMYCMYSWQILRRCIVSSAYLSIGTYGTQVCVQSKNVLPFRCKIRYLSKKRITEQVS